MSSFFSIYFLPPLLFHTFLLIIFLAFCFQDWTRLASKKNEGKGRLALNCTALDNFNFNFNARQLTCSSLRLPSRAAISARFSVTISTRRCSLSTVVVVVVGGVMIVLMVELVIVVLLSAAPLSLLLLQSTSAAPFASADVELLVLTLMPPFFGHCLLLLLLPPPPLLVDSRMLIL